jgi:hypothetical protein
MIGVRRIPSTNATVRIASIVRQFFIFITMSLKWRHALHSRRFESHLCPPLRLPDWLL